jgi:prophage regulatory protein
MRLLSPGDLKPKGAWFSNQYRLELESEGKYPRRVKIGARRYGYVEDEIDAWLKECIALRDGARPQGSPPPAPHSSSARRRPDKAVDDETGGPKPR